MKKNGETAAAAPVAAAPAGGAAAPAEEKSEFTVFLASEVIKKLMLLKKRSFTGLGLKEAKDLVEGAPKELKSGVAKKEAEEIKKT